MNVTNNTPLATTLPAAVAATPVVGTGVSAARNDHVHYSAPFFDLLQTAFRTPRKLLALFSSVPVPCTDASGLYTDMQIGIGLRHVNSIASTAALGTLTNLLLETYTAQFVGGTSTDVYSNGITVNSPFATAPNKNPRMSIRWFPGLSNANLTQTFAGFWNQATAQFSGVGLRALTTGNLFFVTRQGATETTTDLGARPTALTSYEIETTNAGVTWTCRNVTTSTVVATHTTNVPTATAGLGYYVAAVGSSVNGYNLSYCEVESNTVA